MALLEHVRRDNIRIMEDPMSKDQVLQYISHIASGAEGLGMIPEDDIYRNLERREGDGSTAIGEGIAIPHCGFEEAEEFVVGLLMLRRGIAFDAPDGKPVDLFFFIIGPTGKRNEHIQILSEITRSTRDKDTLKRIRGAKTPDDIAGILTGSEEFGRRVVEFTKASAMTVYVQDVKIFDEVLELFTAEPECYITVFEGSTAGKFLHHLPLFASFWTDNEPEQVRVITANLKKSACNNMIRRINAIRDTASPDAEILVTVSDLEYWSGNLSL